MEPITLCGAVILMFGIWVEFEPRGRAVVRVICKSKFFTETFSPSPVKKPVYVRRMPICFAKGFHY